MRVEFWPNTPGRRHDDFMVLELPLETVDFILGLERSVIQSSSATINPSEEGKGRLRYRVRSALMLHTLCKAKLKEMPELSPIAAALLKQSELQWEIRVPTDEWEIGGGSKEGTPAPEQAAEEAPELSSEDGDAETEALERELDVAFDGGLRS